MRDGITDEKRPSAASDGLPQSEVDIGVGFVDETRVPQPSNWIGKLSERLEGLAGLETRGFERVPEEGRLGKVTARTYFEIFSMWFGINCTSNAVNIGILGPVVFGLGFTDSMLLVTFGTLLGAACAGYLGTFGPESGCRTMVGPSTKTLKKYRLSIHRLCLASPWAGGLRA
jgi:hypothetical protein